MIEVPGMKTKGANAREIWQARSTRVKRERRLVATALMGQKKPVIPCSVLLTRCAPSAGLDDDNLTAALKGVRDQVADWLGVNDRDRTRVRYRYAQKRAPWGVCIEFGPPVQGAQLEFDLPAPAFADQLDPAGVLF